MAAANVALLASEKSILQAPKTYLSRFYILALFSIFCCMQNAMWNFCEYVVCTALCAMARSGKREECRIFTVCST
jgi:hypothetical protein